MPWSFDDFDLSKWKLTLPVDEDYFDDDGGDGNFLDDSAYEVKGTALEGFESEYFYFDPVEGGLVFRTPVEGAKTSSNTRYARTELREMDGLDRAAWTLDEGGTMSATLKVTEMAAEYDGDPSRIVIGQIHGQTDELVRLYYNSDGEFYFANEMTGSDQQERLFYFENELGERPNASLGETFSYLISVHEGQLTVALHVDGQTYWPVATDGLDPTEIISAWADDAFYFKAGVYQGVNTTAGHDSEGEGISSAVFYDLDMSHEPDAGRDAWTGEADFVVSPDPNIQPTPDLTVSPETVHAGGGDGDDILVGTDAGEVIKGRVGDDIIQGGGGEDELWGNDGNDVLDGRTGRDWLKGGNGADIFVISDLDSVDIIADFSTSNGDKIDLRAPLQGSAGLTSTNALTDGFVRISQNGTVAELSIRNADGEMKLVAYVQGAAAGEIALTDLIVTNDLTEPQVLPTTTSETEDQISPDDGAVSEPLLAETTTPPTSTDTSKQVSGDSSNETIHGADGDDELRGNDGDDSIYGYAGNDLLKGGNGADTLYGGAGSDELWGNDGDDILDGGAGKDWIKGGAGADVYVISSSDAVDTIADFSQSNGDRLDLQQLLGDFESLSQRELFSTGIVQLVQNGSATDVFVGVLDVADRHVATLLDTAATELTFADFLLTGDPVDDPTVPVMSSLAQTVSTVDQSLDQDQTLAGATDAPLNLKGSAAADKLTGSSLNDELRGEDGDDAIFGYDGDDLLKGGNDNDYLSGGDGMDELWGNSGDDTLIGGAGADWLKGGSGADVFVFNSLVGVDTVADFSHSNGDLLDVSDLLAGGQSTDGGLLGAEAVFFVQNGDHTELLIDLDGENSGHDPVHIATLLYESASAMGGGDLIF